MSIVPTITSTNDNIKRLPATKPIIAGACTVAFYIAFFSANCNPVKYPKQSLSDVRVVSTDTTKWRMYNSGNINLYWDGVSTVDTDLLQSYKRISEIRRLENNWNGNGAVKFSNELLDSIWGIVNKLPRQPLIFPTARESVQLEYENNSGDYLEFELFEGGRIKKFFCGHDGQTVTEYILKETVCEAVNRFYEF